MYERKSSPLISKKAYLQRLLKNFLWATFILIFSLGIGVGGYYYLAHLSILDSFLNASMILTGMGPVNPMPDGASKIFSSLYALYSRVAFLSTIAVFIAPMIHRFMHRFHLEEEEV